MMKTSTKWMFFLLAVVMALVAIANGQDRRASKVFPPEEEDEYGRGSYGGYDRYGDRGRGRGRYGGEDEQDRRASKVFPPEEDYGRGGDRGYGGYGGGDEDRSARKVFPPEEQRGRGGGRGREFPPEEEYGPGGSGGGGRKGWTEKRRYILSDSERVVATDAGGMRVVRGVGGRFRDSPMHIGFITMEPDSMFIPQYLDSSLILFVERGMIIYSLVYTKDQIQIPSRTKRTNRAKR
ncbi:putative rmlC-like cupin domain superfamily, rmlC-like jelly roll protein [Helianthus annuus]|nr:putative rmlC-like cupin domain superfamily, rmlC-like jelly roll protein [Helianthus annuus]KAJ0671332.1 putative rmlC-like cupin domain superfamily, rmlC-like jelly roll protein [Helianthus annuus]